MKPIEGDDPCLIYMNASVLAFPFIETVNLKFTADFFLNLRSNFSIKLIVHTSTLEMTQLSKVLITHNNNI